jgi:hypothetical protein
MQRKCLYATIAIPLLFVAVVLYYVVSPVYLGVLPIGIITGICVLAQMAAFVLAVKTLIAKPNRQKPSILTIATLIISGLSMLGMGYFFVVWWMIF